MMAYHNYFWNEVVPAIIKYEGSDYVNDPADPGGPTKYGWTLHTYKRVINHQATADTIMKLTQNEAMTYYKTYFWDRYGASQLAKGTLATTLMLAQINLGPYRPNLLLQKMTNHYCNTHLKLDGIIGVHSTQAINSCKYLWPDYPYVLYYFYSSTPKIQPVWKWAHKGLRNRIFHGVDHD